MTKNIIPTINISSIVNGSFDSPKSIKTINKIKKAFINIVFFQITWHGISQKNIEKIKADFLWINLYLSVSQVLMDQVKVPMLKNKLNGLIKTNDK